jgi:hypothetical protein
MIGDPEAVKAAFDADQAWAEGMSRRGPLRYQAWVLAEKYGELVASSAPSLRLYASAKTKEGLLKQLPDGEYRIVDTKEEERCFKGEKTGDVLIGVGPWKTASNRRVVEG